MRWELRAACEGRGRSMLRCGSTLVLAGSRSLYAPVTKYDKIFKANAVRVPQPLGGRLMVRTANEFRIVTHWRIEATIDEVAAVLNDALALPEWWSDVYLGTEITDAGDANGIGRTVAVHSKGWLPYHLNWTATLIESHRPHGWTIEASGDLEGQGVWTLIQAGPIAEVEYDWRVKAERPVLRLLSPILAPVFAWNHRWAMKKGETALRNEIVRRRSLE